MNAAETEVLQWSHDRNGSRRAEVHSPLKFSWRTHPSVAFADGKEKLSTGSYTLFKIEASSGDIPPGHPPSPSPVPSTLMLQSTSHSVHTPLRTASRPPGARTAIPLPAPIRKVCSSAPGGGRIGDSVRISSRAVRGCRWVVRWGRCRVWCRFGTFCDVEFSWFCRGVVE